MGLFLMSKAHWEPFVTAPHHLWDHFEGDVGGEAPGTITGGGGDFAAMVGGEARLQIVGVANVTTGGVGEGLEQVDVVHEASASRSRLRAGDPQMGEGPPCFAEGYSGHQFRAGREIGGGGGS